MLLKSRIRFFLMLMALQGMSLFAQPEVKLAGPYQARPGFGTGITLNVLRKGISGPVRFIQTLPSNWVASRLPPYNYGLEQTGNKLTITWLDFPLRDTIKIAYNLEIPKDAEYSKVFDFDGKLEYFEGDKIKEVYAKPHKVKLVKYYSVFQ